ncbi:MAG: hypothetical protein VYE22_12410 [Myxococcota bacterium]|nr:hypothetical protein [Myxococcota bacterium]
MNAGYATGVVAAVLAASIGGASATARGDDLGPGEWISLDVVIQTAPRTAPLCGGGGRLHTLHRARVVGERRPVAVAIPCGAAITPGSRLRVRARRLAWSRLATLGGVVGDVDRRLPLYRVARWTRA